VDRHLAVEIAVAIGRRAGEDEHVEAPRRAVRRGDEEGVVRSGVLRDRVDRVATETAASKSSTW